MRLTVLGAAGRTGRHVVNQATIRGYDVRALIHRTPATFPDGVEVVHGDARNRVVLGGLAAGTDAVVSAIRPDDSYPDVMGSLSYALVLFGAGPLVVTSHPAGIALPGHARARPELIGHKFAASVLAAERELEWFLVVPAPQLTNEPGSGRYLHEVAGGPPGPSIAREDLATALLDALGSDPWMHTHVGVSN